MGRKKKKGSRKRKLVFVNGCFDIYHVGHLAVLRHAWILADGGIVVVGLNSDESVRIIKGTDRPIHPFKNRRAILESVRYVDSVYGFSEEKPFRLIKNLEPDIIVKGRDWQGREHLCIPDGIKCKVDTDAPWINGCSTTEIIEKVMRNVKAPSGQG